MPRHHVKHRAGTPGTGRKDGANRVPLMGLAGLLGERRHKAGGNGRSHEPGLAGSLPDSISLKGAFGRGPASTGSPLDVNVTSDRRRP